MKNFALIGAAGYIAPRHMRAIRDIGGNLVAAVDPNDSVGQLDQYSYNIKFFTEIERFDRFLEKLRRGPEENRVNYVSICSPNYLHDAHCRLAMRVGANVICEKPLVINPWNLEQLQELEAEFGKKVNTVLQLRLHPALIALREKLKSEQTQHDVLLTYITSRGNWYDVSWKGDPQKSGGIAVNIGIHLFDLLIWLFGEPKECQVFLSEPRQTAGWIAFENAKVRWFLSLDTKDLPEFEAKNKKFTYRSISIDGQEVEFSEGFTDLHTRVYERTLTGSGFGIDDARPSIDLTYQIRKAAITIPTKEQKHPFLDR
jgi:UDP-N-acetyl-2-amino-2-deoxyglucuronate dehydrogenase